MQLYNRITTRTFFVTALLCALIETKCSMINNDINSIPAKNSFSHDTAVPLAPTIVSSSTFSPRHLKSNKSVDDDISDSEKQDDDDYNGEDDEVSSSEVDTSNDNEKKNSMTFDDLESCVPISQCELCQGGKQSGQSGCSNTGKRIKMRCQSINANAVDIDEVSIYKSCNRTSMDEEYLVVQFQALCLFIAFFSIRSVRKEKIASASLFEMRARRRIRQEMVPLNLSRGTSGGNNNNNDIGGNVGEDIA